MSAPLRVRKEQLFVLLQVLLERHSIAAGILHELLAGIEARPVHRNHHPGGNFALFRHANRLVDAETHHLFRLILNNIHAFEDMLAGTLIEITHMPE